MTGRARVGGQILAVGVVAALLGLLVWKVAKGDDNSVTSSLAEGKMAAAPDFTLAKLDGDGELALESLRGKAVVLNFWASWCGPCKMVAPEFVKVAAQGAGRWLVVKVNTEEAPNLGARFNIRAIPTMVVLQRGAELARQAGAMPAARITQFIEQAVRAPAG